MRVARIVFRIAGVWGILLLLPMFFLYDRPSIVSDAPIPYPQAYHGFLGVALAWQVAFLVIASDPVRFRPMMIPAVLEKASFVAISGVLFGQGQIGFNGLVNSGPDAVLGLLFLVAYLRTPSGRPGMGV